MSAKPHLESRNVSKITVGSLTLSSDVLTFIYNERNTKHTKDSDAINIVVVGM